MSTTTHRETASFEIAAGTNRRRLVQQFDEALGDIEIRVMANDTEVLWDMLRVEYHQEERDEARNIAGDVAFESTWPARVVVTVPVVVTT